MTADDDRATHAITVEAPPDEVWSVITDDDELSTWLGDGAVLDPVPGGEGQVIDDDGVLRHIRVEEVDEGRSIRWLWWPGAHEDDATSVEITVVPVEDGSEVRVVETAPVASGRAESSSYGFGLALELFRREQAGRPAPGPDRVRLVGGATAAPALVGMASAPISY